jgi:hypothetical protein
LENEEQGQQQNNDDNNMDVIWYSDGLIPPSRANLAFSLYGKLKSTNTNIENVIESMIGGTSMKCNSKNYINSFYTTAGFDVFLQSLASAGITTIQDLNANDDGSSTSLSSTCTLVNDVNGNQVGQTVACWGDQFATYQFSSTSDSTYSTCYDSTKGIEVDSLVDLNSNLTEYGNCAIVYTNSSLDSITTLLQNSASCTIRDSIGKHACPDPYGKIKKYVKARKTQSVYRRISLYGRRILHAYLFIIFGCLAFICSIYVYGTYHYDKKKKYFSNMNNPFSIDYVETCGSKVNDDDVSTLGGGGSEAGLKKNGNNGTRALAAGSDGQQESATPMISRVARIHNLIKRLKDSRKEKTSLTSPKRTKALLPVKKSTVTSDTIATRDDTVLQLDDADAFSNGERTILHVNKFKPESENETTNLAAEVIEDKTEEIDRGVVGISDDMPATKNMEVSHNDKLDKDEHCNGHDNVNDDCYNVTSASSSTSSSDANVDDIVFGRQISFAPSFRSDCDETF